jgi:hypothetical protein
MTVLDVPNVQSFIANGLRNSFNIIAQLSKDIEEKDSNINKLTTENRRLSSISEFNSSSIH